MTKEYDQIDPHDALYNAARDYPGGIAALALRLATSEKVLRNKLAPDVDTHHTNLEEFARIVECLDGVKPASADLAVDALMWRLNRVAMRLPTHAGDVDADRIMQQVLEIFHEEGDLAKAVNEFLGNDGKIDDRELAQIEKLIQIGIDGLITLRDEVREKNKRDMTGR